MKWLPTEKARRAADSSNGNSGPANVSSCSFRSKTGLIVLCFPGQAVIQDGLESIVFVKKGELVTRVPVVEKYRDARVGRCRR